MIKKYFKFLKIICYLIEHILQSVYSFLNIIRYDKLKKKYFYLILRSIFVLAKNEFCCRVIIKHHLQRML